MTDKKTVTAGDALFTAGTYHWALTEIRRELGKLEDLQNFFRDKKDFETADKLRENLFYIRRAFDYVGHFEKPIESKGERTYLK